MLPLFYHDRRTGTLARSLVVAIAAIVWGLAGSGCGRPSSASPATPSIGATPATPAPTLVETQTDTPTAQAIDRGRALLEQLRQAAGGPALTALKSVEVTGASMMTSVKAPRQLHVIARFPMSFRLEESPAPGSAVPAPRVVVGVDGESGWMLGARLGGDGQSKDVAVAARAYTRAARQTMAGLLVGISAPWLFDSGRYTFSDLGAVTAGDDRDAWQLQIDGPDGRVGRLLIDPHTRLPRRLIEPPQPGGGGTAAIADIVFTYSDFQPQGGLQLPRTVVRENGTNRTIWSIAKYALNPTLPARRFGRGAR